MEASFEAGGTQEELITCFYFRDPPYTKPLWKEGGRR